MSVVASTIEAGTHPATILIVGGLVAAILRGRFASFALVLAPLFGLGYVATLEVGATSTMELFGYEILGVVVDQQDNTDNQSNHYKVALHSGIALIGCAKVRRRSASACS